MPRPRRWPFPFLLLSLLRALAAPAAAVPPGPYLVRDIGEAPERGMFEIFRPTRFVTAGGALFFLVDDGVHGAELWKSNGTAAGTGLIKDLCPGACGSIEVNSTYLGLASAGGKVVFVGHDGIHGTEPWVTDGTVGGTQMLADLRPGLSSSQPRWLASSGGLVFFAVNPSGGPASELWRSDGTPQGTMRIETLPVGDCLLPSPVGGLFFSVYSSDPAVAGLWWTNGAPGTAVRLHPSVYCYPVGTAMNHVAILADGTLLFAQPDELWRSDGTVAGTYRVKQLAVGSQNPVLPQYMQSTGDAVFFTHSGPAVPRLWRSDGTADGTYEIALPEGVHPNLFQSHSAAGGRFFFAGFDNTRGRELWTVDGAAARLVKDLRPGSEWSLPFEVWPTRLFRDVGGRLLFMADDGVNGEELWVSDGSEAGTSMVADLAPGLGSIEVEMASFYGRPPLFQGKTPFVRFRGDQGHSLWLSDGTPQGTYEVAPLRAQRSALASRPLFLGYLDVPLLCQLDYRGRLLFDARRGSSAPLLWSSDGTEAGTATVGEDTAEGWFQRPQDCTAVNGWVLFGAFQNDQGGLWRSNLTSGGTAPIDSGGATLWLRGDYTPDPLPLLRGKALFLTSDALWQTAGSEADLLADSLEFCSPHGTASTGDLGFFGSCDLWRTDGTIAGTFKIEAADSTWEHPRSLAVLGSKVIYLAQTPLAGEEPWVSDGSEEGTFMLRDIFPGPGSSSPAEYGDSSDPSGIAVAGGLAFFAADDGVHGEELWATDGTPSGTRRVADLFPGAYPSSPRELTALGERLYFVAEHPALGRELWVSDGSALGTAVVADLLPGNPSSLPQELAAVDGRLFFSAWNATFGRELWRLAPGANASDLPQRISDLAPGPLSASPHSFVFAGGLVYFAANDQSHGFELWALPARTLFADGFELGHPFAWSEPGPP